MTETTAFCTFLTALVVSVVLLYTVLAVLTPVSVELVKDTPAAVSRINHTVAFSELRWFYSG